MTHAHGGVLVVLVAFFGGLVVGQLAQSVGTRTALRRAARHALAPRESARLAFALLALPLVLGMAGLLATLAVPLHALLDPARDHCILNAGAPHVCFVHGTWAFRGPADVVGVALLATLLVTAIAREVMRLVVSRRRARALLRGLDDGEGITIAPDHDRYAFAIGVRRPRVIVSRGLVEALTPAELGAAIAHEHAHVARRHGAARVLARLVAAFVVDGPARRALLSRFVLGQEREADEDAALAVESRALVAEALLASMRPARAGRVDAAPALDGADTAARVEALCRAPDAGRVTGVLLFALVTLVAVFATTHAAIHDAAEATAAHFIDAPVHTHVRSSR